VEITYRLSGRKWQRDQNSEVKYFLNAEAMGFKVLQKGDEAPPAAEPYLDESEAGDEDVPF
jgi:hypothetical protein